MKALLTQFTSYVIDRLIYFPPRQANVPAGAFCDPVIAKITKFAFVPETTGYLAEKFKHNCKAEKLLHNVKPLQSDGSVKETRVTTTNLHHYHLVTRLQQQNSTGVTNRTAAVV